MEETEPIVGDAVMKVKAEEEEPHLPGLPFIPDPDYATPYIPAMPSPDYTREERKTVERDSLGGAKRYLGRSIRERVLVRLFFAEECDDQFLI